MSGQRKRRRHMDIPPPIVIRDFRSDLDQTLFLLSPHESVVGPYEGVFQNPEALFRAQDIILKPRQLDCPARASLAFANGKAKSRIDPTMSSATNCPQGSWETCGIPDVTVKIPVSQLR